MEKRVHWLKKDFNSLSVVLLILIIPLYIIYFGEYINDKTVNILLAIAALLSTFFLYLAFRESRLSNKLKLIEPLFNQFENEINELEKLDREKLFSEINIELISTYINYPKIHLQRITFSNISQFARLITYIVKNLNYGTYLDQYNKHKEGVIKEQKYDSGIADLVKTMEKIDLAFLLITSYHTKYYMRYFLIDQSDFEISHKIYLIQRLNKFNYEFNQIKIFYTAENQDANALMNFLTFEYDNKSQTIKSVKKLDVDFLLRIYDKVEIIRNKYKDISGEHF